MGDRGQILMKNSSVTLYSHWGASELVEDVRSALQKKARWDDEEYLTRIIFCQMIKGDEDGETGYGIGASVHGDIWRLIIIDVDAQTIEVKNNEKVDFSGSFEDFIKWEEPVDD